MAAIPQPRPSLYEQLEALPEGLTGEILKASWRERIDRLILKAMIALPKMRKQPYPMLLGRTPGETAMLPREPGKVTMIE